MQMLSTTTGAKHNFYEIVNFYFRLTKIIFTIKNFLISGLKNPKIMHFKIGTYVETSILACKIETSK